MPCLDCLDDSKTLIPAPECQGDCPDDLGCVDIVNSNCVIVNPALPCVNQTSGVNLSTALQAIDAKLCQNSSNVSTCKVKVSATDECCDFLNPKIGVGNGLTKSIVRNNNCEVLTISHPTWSDVNFNQVLNPFSLGLNGLYVPKASTYFNGSQRVHEVKLNGAFTSVITPPGFLNGQTQITLTSLPIGIPAPLTDYFYNYTHFDNNGNVVVYSLIIFGQITLFIAGQIVVKAKVLTGAGNITDHFISLDGINYRI